MWLRELPVRQKPVPLFVQPFDFHTFYLFFFFQKIYLFIYLTALGLLAACELSLVVVALRHVGS